MNRTQLKNLIKNTPNKEIIPLPENFQTILPNLNKGFSSSHLLNSKQNFLGLFAKNQITDGFLAFLTPKITNKVKKIVIKTFLKKAKIIGEDTEKCFEKLIQENITFAPNLDFIIPTPKTIEKFYTNSYPIQIKKNNITTIIFSDTLNTQIDIEKMAFIYSLIPNPIFKSHKDTAQAPMLIYDNNTLAGLVMPLKS